MGTRQKINNDSCIRLQRVKIKNFKQIRELDLLLDEGMNIFVGDNEAGKTSILEAIVLATTGRFRGEPIGRCLSEYLFNRDSLEEYLKSLKGESPEPPPQIEIEIFFKSGETGAPIFQGSNNSEHDRKAFGYRLTIALDEDYATEYESLVRLKELTSLPIEYYSARFTTFADERISQRLIPIKAALIDPSSELLSSRADSRAVRTLCGSLDDELTVGLAQEYRVALKKFQHSEIVQRIGAEIKRNPKLTKRCIALDVNTGTKDSWKSELSVTSEDIPYAYIGSGMQCVIQSEIVLSSAQGKGIDILLVEEPENHLSHARLNEYLSQLKDGSEQRQIVLTTHSSFVANKLGLNAIHLVSKSPDGTSVQRLMNADDETQAYFRRLPGYDTLRFVLCEAAILVEGPSDELIVQRAYMDSHDGKLPIDDGIDIISVGLSFERFLKIAHDLKRKIAIVTDNDGKPEELEEKYQKYRNSNEVLVSFDNEVHPPAEGDDPNLRWDTLEATILRSNDIQHLASVLNRKDSDKNSLLKWMESNKTKWALRVFESKDKIEYPDYIVKAIEHVQ